MAVLTPSTTTGYNLQKWQKEVEGATYQKMLFIPRIDEGDRLYHTLNIRKHQRVAVSTLAQSAEGTSLSAETLAGTPVTVTPSGRYVKIAWSQNEAAQIDFNLNSEAQGEIEQAVAEASDTAACANIASLTNFLSVAEVTAAEFRRAYGNLMQNTNGMATPGKDPQIYGIFAANQYPALASIPEFNNAEVRGDSENPNVKGIWMRGGGVMLMLTTVLTEDGNGTHNCLFIPSAFVVSWNQRTQIIRDRSDLQEVLIAYNNFGSAVKHNARAYAIRTTASGL